MVDRRTVDRRTKAQIKLKARRVSIPEQRKKKAQYIIRRRDVDIPKFIRLPYNPRQIIPWKPRQVISQHHTKKRAEEANRQYSKPSYVRKDKTPSPFRWDVVRRRKRIYDEEEEERKKRRRRRMKKR